MRVLRAKVVRKTLRFYKIVFGIDGPFHIILDGNFIFAAIKFKIDIRDRLQKLLQGAEIKLYVLSSIIQELEKVGVKAQSALEFAKTCCEVINDERIIGETASDRLLKLIGNQGATKAGGKSSSKRYFVVTQDAELRTMLGARPGIPVLYLNKVTLVLEPPSGQSQEHNKEVELTKVQLSAEEEQIMHRIQEIEAQKASREEVARTKERLKRKAAAPNPLSAQAASEDSKSSKKRKLSKFRG